MDGNAETFCELIGRVVRRFSGQNGLPAPADAEVAAFGARLWAIVGERGLPEPLAPGETGAPGEMTEAECAPLVARVAPAGTPPLLAEAARQLVKACFYPEFKTCRDSYCATAHDGTCRRQELARARKRVSGTHCVDCPHWIALGPAEHEQFLGERWRGERREFAAHRGVFLPEDFRAFRRWLHAQARRGPRSR